jgi:hypothetical protein
MAQICRHCRSANPTEAAYCYHDGTLLEGHVSTDGRAMDVAARPFVVPFVFPYGRVCHNFNELVAACQEDPAAAIDLLREGHLGAFLGGQGRADLALAAKAAVRAADGERGLDEFLGRLPGTAQTPARLRVEPAVLDLGTLRPGEDRRGELVLINEGTRLLYGTAGCVEPPWLSLGNGQELRCKLFQFSSRTVLPVHVLGSLLRAQRKPQEAEIVLESNGGTVTAVVRVDVPARPFPDGILAGALTPRQIVEKAHGAPREAAALIESGAVARWYAANGWSYPVPGLAAVGLAAVQQLFEALGVVKTPRVELSEEAVRLRGRPGEAIEHVLAVITQENRAAVAFGASDQPWLQVGRTVFRGRSAMVPLTVPAVPSRPGEMLTAQVTVVANGGQRFVVPVTLAVAAAVSGPALGILVSSTSRKSPAAARRKPPRRSSPARIWLEVAGVLLIAGLMLFQFRGLFFRNADNAAEPLTLAFQDDPKDESVGAATMTFGLVLAGPGKSKRLTYDERGRTNNTCYRLDGRDFLLGYEGGQWQRPSGRSVWLHQDVPIAVIQDVAIVPGPQSGRPDTCLVRYTIENRDKAAHKVGLRFLLDTFVGGRDGVPFAVPGKDQLCDTSCDLQGADVPDFLQALETGDPANPGTVAHLTLRLGWRLEAPGRVTLGAWPDEQFKAKDPRALANLTRWEVPLLSLKEPADSAVTLYWPEKELGAGARREVGFAYGLGEVTGDGRLALAVGGSFLPGGEWSVAAYVKGAAAGESLTLELPAGLMLAGGKEVTAVPVPPAGASPLLSLVTWRVRSAPADRANYEVRVRSSAGPAQVRTVTVAADRRLE